MSLTTKNFFRKLSLLKIIFAPQLRLSLIILGIFLLISVTFTVTAFLLFSFHKTQPSPNPSPIPNAITSNQPIKPSSPAPDSTQVARPSQDQESNVTSEIIISPTTPLYQANDLISPWYEQYFFNTNDVYRFNTSQLGAQFVDQNRSQKLVQMIAQKASDLNCTDRNNVVSSFANILSLRLSSCNYYLNIRLDTMEEINFSDLWLPGTDVLAIIRQGIRKTFFNLQTPGDEEWEMAYFNAMQEHAQNDQVPTGSFAIENTGIRFYLSNPLPMEQGYIDGLDSFTVSFADHRDRAVVYRKFLTQEPLFSPVPTKTAYVFHDPTFYHYHDGEFMFSATYNAKSNNNIYYALDTPFDFQNLSEDFGNQTLRNAIAKHLDDLHNQIEQQFSILPTNSGEIIVVSIYLDFSDDGYYDDENLLNEITDTTAVVNTKVKSLKIPKIIDNLNVTERRDWVFAQLGQNRFNFPGADIKVTLNNKVFDQNGADVSHNYCFFNDNVNYLLKNSTAYFHFDGTYHADQNCNITKVQ